MRSFFFFFHRGLGLGNVYNSPDVKAGSSLSHADLLIPRSHTSSVVFYPMVLSSIVSRSHGVYGKLLEMQSLGWCLTRCAWGCLWGVRMGVYSFSTLSVTKPSSNLVLVQPLEGRGDSEVLYSAACKVCQLLVCYHTINHAQVLGSCISTTWLGPSLKTWDLNLLFWGRIHICLCCIRATVSCSTHFLIWQF